MTRNTRKTNIQKKKLVEAVEEEREYERKNSAKMKAISKNSDSTKWQHFHTKI